MGFFQKIGDVLKYGRQIYDIFSPPAQGQPPGPTQVPQDQFGLPSGLVDPHVNQGYPPGMDPRQPTDIPWVPDYADLQQMMEGENPFTAAGSNGSGLAALMGYNQIVMNPGSKLIADAPPGYVIVDMPDGSGKKAVLKSVARRLGLWKPRKKPPITASEWGKLKAAERVKKKAKKIAQTADFSVKKK